MIWALVALVVVGVLVARQRARKRNRAATGNDVLAAALVQAQAGGDQRRAGFAPQRRKP